MTAAFARLSGSPSWRKAAKARVGGRTQRAAVGSTTTRAANMSAWHAAPESATALAARHPDADPAEVPCSPGRRANDIAAADWDHLFTAVTSRLGRILGEPPAVATMLHETVADCLLALTQLQDLRACERRGDSRLQGQLQRSSGALAAAQLELRQARLSEQQARHDSQHDSLTSLPNRSSFNNRLNQSLQRSDQASPALAVLFLDLDQFKPINDRHGHQTGDELLKIVAARLSRAMRQQDMVCRLGGDEFACILSGPGGREQLGQIAAQLFDAVSAPLDLGGLRFRVRPSMGIALCPSDGTTAATLLKHADSAMYRAKRRQLGFAFFDRGADLAHADSAYSAAAAAAAFPSARSAQ